MDLPAITTASGVSVTECEVPVRFEVSIHIDPADMKGWHTFQLYQFFEGIEAVVNAVRGCARKECGDAKS